MRKAIPLFFIFFSPILLGHFPYCPESLLADDDIHEMVATVQNEQKISKGEKNTNRDIVVRYLYQFFYERLRSQNLFADVKDEIIQNAVIKTMKFLPRFNRERGHFKAWSGTILLNCLREEVKARNRLPKAESPPEEVPATNVIFFDPTSFPAFQEFFESLTERQKEFLKAHTEDARSVEEKARALGVTRGGYDAMICRLRQMLVEKLF